MTPRQATATESAKTTIKPQTQSTTPTKRKPPVSLKAVEYGTKIRKARQQKRVTEQELADELGVSQNKINKIENGSTKLAVEDAERIAEILGMKASELIPSLATVNNYKQSAGHDQATVSGVVFNQNDFEPERKVWQELDKARQDVIIAKDALITAKEETIEALRSALRGIA